MSVATFPETSYTLFAKIHAAVPGQDEAAWTRLADLYVPAMRTFAAIKGAGDRADDIVMVVLAKLVEVLRNGRYDATKGRFHSYLATMIVNEIHMQWRKDDVRRRDAHVSLDELLDETKIAADPQAETPEEQTVARIEESLDADWRRAILASAVEHVLTKTALSALARDVYRLHVQEGRSLEETALKCGTTRNNVSQICSRIERRIAAVGREMVEGM